MDNIISLQSLEDRLRAVETLLGVDNGQNTLLSKISRMEEVMLALIEELGSGLIELVVPKGCSTSKELCKSIVSSQPSPTMPIKKQFSEQKFSRFMDNTKAQLETMKRDFVTLESGFQKCVHNCHESKKRQDKRLVEVCCELNELQNQLGKYKVPVEKQLKTLAVEVGSLQDKLSRMEANLYNISPLDRRSSPIQADGRVFLKQENDVSRGTSWNLENLMADVNASCSLPATPMTTFSETGFLFSTEDKDDVKDEPHVVDLVANTVVGVAGMQDRNSQIPNGSFMAEKERNQVVSTEFGTEGIKSDAVCNKSAAMEMKSSNLAVQDILAEETLGSSRIDEVAATVAKNETSAEPNTNVNSMVPARTDSNSENAIQIKQETNDAICPRDSDRPVTPKKVIISDHVQVKLIPSQANESDMDSKIPSGTVVSTAERSTDSDVLLEKPSENRAEEPLAATVTTYTRELDSLEAELKLQEEKGKLLNKAKANSKKRIKQWMDQFEKENGRPPDAKDKEAVRDLFHQHLEDANAKAAADAEKQKLVTKIEKLKAGTAPVQQPKPAHRRPSTTSTSISPRRGSTQVPPAGGGSSPNSRPATAADKASKKGLSGLMGVVRTNQNVAKAVSLFRAKLKPKAEAGGENRLMPTAPDQPPSSSSRQAPRPISSNLTSE